MPAADRHPARSLRAAALVAAFAIASLAACDPAAVEAGPRRPGRPTGVTAVAAPSGAQVTWTAPADDGGSPITSFVVGWSGGTLAVADPKATTAAVAGLQTGVVYAFSVAAVNAVGAGAWSDSTGPILPTSAVPPTPSITSAFPGVKSVQLAWAAGPANGVATTAFAVTQSSGGPYVESKIGSSTAASALVVGLLDATVYTFRVTSVAGAVAGVPSEPSAPVRTAALPQPPVGLAVVASPHGASLSWTAADDGGSKITAYVVDQQAAGGAWTAATATSTGPTTASVTGLTNAVAYSFSVAARNGVGLGPASAPSVPATTPALPGVPAGFAAVAGPSQISLSWSRPIDGGSALLGYTAVATPVSGGAPVTLHRGPDDTAAVLAPLQPSVSYSCSVRATSLAGDGPSAPPVIVQVPVLPDAPPYVLGAGGPRSATLTWAAPASDGGHPILGYKVLKRKYTELNFSPGSLTLQTATSTTGVVTGLESAMHYTFEIVASTSAGDGPPSPSSVDVVTPDIPAAPWIADAQATADGAVLVSFAAPVYDGGDPIVSYTVFASPGPQTATVPASARQASVGGLDPAVRYTFRAVATNAVGPSLPSGASASLLPVAPAGRPGRAGRPAVNAGIRAVQLSFARPDDGGAAIDGYGVQVNDGSGFADATLDAVDGSGPTVTAHLGGLRDGTTYTFLVAAHNAHGWGANSEASEAVRTARLPARPDLSVTAIGSGTLSFAWTDATLDAGHPVTLYTVEQVSPAGAPARTTAARTMALTGLENGTRYSFRVRATSDVGDGPPSAASAPAAPCPGVGDPATGLCATDLPAVKLRRADGTPVLAGLPVALSGLLVTAVVPGSGFFAQRVSGDPTFVGPDDSGLFCALEPGVLAPGDRVDVSGAVVALAGAQVRLQQPDAAPAATVAIVSRGNALPTPILADAAALATGGARAAALEGVLVAAQGPLQVTAVSPAAAAGADDELVVGGVLRVDGLLSGRRPLPIVGDEITAIAGLLSSRGGVSRLSPRAADVAWGAAPLASLGSAGSPYFTSVGHAPALTFPAVLSAAISLPRTFDVLVGVDSQSAGLLVSGGTHADLRIPAGQTSVSLPITGASRDQAAVVRAATSAGAALSRTVRVLDRNNSADQAWLSELVVPTAPTPAGTIATLEVRFTVPASADTAVSLSYTDAADFSTQPPATVTVQKDQLSAQVRVAIAPLPPTFRSTITASSNGTSIASDLLIAGGLAALLTPAQYEQLLPRHHEVFTYAGLQAAGGRFPNFLNEGTRTDQLRELAALLANVAHETTGGWPAAPGGPYAWGLYFVEEVGCEWGACTGYCDRSNTAYRCADGKTYHGRGPIQLSWNYNYGQAGAALGLDLLNDPDLVKRDPVVSWETALWFWMTPQAPKPSAHDVMIGRYAPTPAEAAAGRFPGFGLTVDIINGGLECGFPTPAAVEDRVGFYQTFTGLLGVTPGANLTCEAMQPFH